jgi:hypothetical protein
MGANRALAEIWDLCGRAGNANLGLCHAAEPGRGGGRTAMHRESSASRVAPPLDLLILGIMLRRVR